MKRFSAFQDKAYNVAAAASQLVNAKFGGDDIDNLLLPALQNGVIWSLLQNYQSDFDPLDIEGVVARVPLDSPLYNEEPSIEEYQAVIHDYVSPFFRFAENDRKLIVAYLLSASFKDCSVFLRFTKDHFSVKVADLDVKSIKKMRHYYELDREIAQNFTKLVEDLAM
jgi:inositol-pentakisphosphate 2-kinase